MRNATSNTGLPASIEAACGLRERPAKGPRRGLSLAQIVQAGVRVAGSDGLAAVSMARVVERVLDGVDALVRARSASTPTGG